MYLYTPVVTTGNSTKLSRPLVGPYYIVEKLSDIYVRIRRKDNNTIVKNRIHINRLKLGYLRLDQLDDPTPPPDSDSVEPAILGESEIPPPRPPAGEAAKHAKTLCPTSHPCAVISRPVISCNLPAPREKTYEIERIIRKSFSNGSWKYRVKWRGFDNSANSWILFADLTPQCQDMGRRIHNKIITDEGSKRKQ